MTDGYYSKRISKNEQRIATLKGELVSRRLTIKALEDENEKLSEAMNNQTHTIDVDKTEQDMKIIQLKKENNTLRKKNKDLKIELEYVKDKLNREISNLKCELLCTTKSNDDVILSDNFGEHNIFEELLGEY